MAKKNKKNVPVQNDQPTDELLDDQTESVNEVKVEDVKKEKQTELVNKKASAEMPPVKVVKSEGKPKQKIPFWGWMAIAFGGLAVIAIIVGFTVFNKSDKSGQRTGNTNVTNENLFPRKLDGVPVPDDKKNTNIFAIMVENIKESRPPSGLDRASVVYEALAEGGITRFMALFPVGESVFEIGPVRSARSYYVSWAEEYHPLYVHVGGSPQALSYIKGGQANIIDFNQFYNAPYFWRDKTRPAPHNLYTSTDQLYMGLKRTKKEADMTYTSWAFKDEASIESRQQDVKDIVINFSSFNYQVTYKYDRAMNRYQRYQADAPHVNRDTNPIYAKNIVVQFTKTGLIAGDKQRLEMETVGTGKMLMFRDGIAIEGTWKKDSASGRTTWYDLAGTELALNAGPIWIEILPQDRQVTY